MLARMHEDSNRYQKTSNKFQRRKIPAFEILVSRGHVDEVPLNMQT
jgi:hypothetical protein